MFVGIPIIGYKDPDTAPVPCQTVGFRVIRVNIRASRPSFSTSQRVQRTWTSSHGGSHTVEDRFSVTVEIGISETTSTADSFRSDRRAVLSTFNIEKCRTLSQKQLMCGAYMINLSFLPTSTKHVVHPSKSWSTAHLPTKKIHEMTLPTSNSHFLKLQTHC